VWTGLCYWSGHRKGIEWNHCTMSIWELQGRKVSDSRAHGADPAELVGSIGPVKATVEEGLKQGEVYCAGDPTPVDAGKRSSYTIHRIHKEGTMKKSVVLGTILLSVILVAGLLPSTSAPGLALQEETQSDAPQRAVNVSGTGRVSAQPDVAVVTLGVQTEAEDAATALSQNSQQMQALVDALKEAGIAADDIQTQVVSLYPRYQQSPDVQGQGELIGYTATNTVAVRIRELDKVGETLDTAVQAGGNRIESIGFEVSDPSQYMDQAREAAWNDALHKAEQLASLAGVGLSEVLTISESGSGPQPVVERPVAAAASAAVPIEPGSQTIEVDLQVTWLLTEAE
jgi:uncharacterized protein YggE